MAWGQAVRRGCELAITAARFNLLWVGGTLAGGILLGVAPSTVAIAELARRESLGTHVRPWREFGAAYRRTFVPANLLLAPVAVAASMLWADVRLAGRLPPPATSVARGLLLLLAVALAAAVLHLVPLYVHYDLTVAGCLRRAGIVALRQTPTTLLLLFGLNCWIQLVSAIPVLAVLFGAGGWLWLNTWLCLHAYRHNDASLAPAARLTVGNGAALPADRVSRSGP